MEANPEIRKWCFTEAEKIFSIYGLLMGELNKLGTPVSLTESYIQIARIIEKYINGK